MDKSNKIPTINQNFDVDTFSEVIKKSGVVIIVIFILSMIGGYLYNRYSQPIYSASSIVQVKKENKASEILNLNSDANQIESVLEVLRSEEFLKTVIGDLQLKTSFFVEGTFMSTEVYGSLPLAVEFEINNPSIYDKAIYYYLSDDEKSYEITYDIDGRECKKNVPFNEWTNINEGKLCMSAPTNASAIDKKSIKKTSYFTINSEKATLKKISENLNISILNKNAGTIQIIYTSFNSQKTSDITNAIASKIIAFDIIKNKESTSATIKYIDEQLENLLEDLSITENALQKFKLENSIGDKNSVPDKTDFNVTKISELESKIFNIDYELKVLDEITEKLQNNPELNVYEMMAMMTGQESEAFLSSMLKSLQDLITKKESLLFDVTENSHKIKVIDSQIESKKQTIINFIVSTKSRLKNEKVEYLARNRELEKTLYSNTLGYNELEYSKLMRLYSLNESFYSQLLKAKTEIMISQAGFVSNNMVLEKAISPAPQVAPNLKKAMIMSLVIALILSAIFIFLRYMLFNKILNVSDIKRYTDIPVIGEVVKSEFASVYSSAVAHRNASSRFTECFRKIRVNLDFYPIANKCRVILLTSTIPTEGKSFVALNLADVYAMADKKVLIIDFDLRKPRLHKGMDVKNGVGISTLIVGKNTLAECIQHTQIENLDIITSGPVSPNAAELLSNQALGNIMNKLKEMYDIIVLDTPPTGIIHDAIILSKYADNIFYVLRSGLSARGFLEYINNLKESHSLKNLSIVLNGVDSKKRSSYEYASYGKYSYKYSYDDSEGKEKENNKFFTRLFKNKR